MRLESAPPGLAAMTQRLADQAMRLAAGDVAGVAAWLVRIGGRVAHRDAHEASLVGPSGLGVGLMPSDPLSCAQMLGFAVFGPWWPMVVPGLLPEVKRRWRDQKKGAEYSVQSAGKAPPNCTLHPAPCPLPWRPAEQLALFGEDAG